MKVFLILICAFFLLACSQAQQVITGTVTITNLAGTTNGDLITVNGTTRIWTNNVTSAQNQIQIATNIMQSWTNLFYAYAAVPVAGVNLSAHGTNIVQFQSAHAGAPLTMSIYSNWATLVFTTNTIGGTNAGVFRYPPSNSGVVEQTNEENALMIFLNDNKMTSILNPSAPAFANFLNIGVLLSTSNFLWNFSYTNWMSNSNLTYLIGQYDTNYTLANWLNSSNALFNFTNGIPDSSAAYFPMTYFQPACDLLSNICALGTLQGLSYIEAGSGNILLANTNGTTRLKAFDPTGVMDSGSTFELNYDNGNHFLFQDSSRNLFLYDNGGNERYEQDDQGTSSSYNNQTQNGDTVLRTGFASPALVIQGVSGTLQLQKHVIANFSTCPVVLGGSVTNFVNVSVNSGSSLTPVNYVSIPGNTMTNNGDSLVRAVGVTYSSSLNTKQVQVNFGGSTILDTGSIANSGSGGVSLTVELTVQDNTTLTSAIMAYRCQAIITGTASTVKASSGVISGVDLTTSPDFHLSIGESSGTTGDMKVDSDNVRFFPSANWQGL